MFQLDGELKLVTIDMDYVKAMHTACPEVYYQPYEYDNKPYIGIIIVRDCFRYVIPITSAKKKHMLWRNIGNDHFLIYEHVPQSVLSSNDIYVPLKGAPDVKHILSVIDVKKMIPILDSVYHVVNLNAAPSDTPEQRKYKDLMGKEYAFSVRISDKILSKATKIYENQKQTGKVIRYGCDFAVLEHASEVYKSKETIRI